MSKEKKGHNTRISVIGAGSWGTTLAILLDSNGCSVSLWEYFPEQAEALRRDRENKRFLPGIPIPASVRVTSDLEEALENPTHVLFVSPSHTMRKIARMVSVTKGFNRQLIAINASKGLEEKTLCRMSEVLSQELPLPKKRIVGLLGPSHAEEVSRRMPTSIVVAGSDMAVLKSIQDVFMNEYFRVYTNRDLVGVELGVSLKNTIAIAAGICDGLGFGDNTKAALLTRGLAETKRLACRMGAKDDTLSGLAGVGDLIVTCMSRHSRNRHVGEEIGRGKSLKQVLSEMVMVAEGVKTTKAAIMLASRVNVELPITEQVYKVLFNKKDPRKAIRDLMIRKARNEMYR
ncbi:MAG: NAD(P)H-dependent glycerol-3-phosphate dehydrogenase [Candidatus Krumholzibacteria bacterium]|jgi:glycerol-3-phosphate dehydrogenase (NAD(P)+)|nr:NAD(P)H-dependent glycerol-3-phosphate dehydrogenase [Candidatus Krumholzibacteria bacterium]